MKWHNKTLRSIYNTMNSVAFDNTLPKAKIKLSNQILGNCAITFCDDNYIKIIVYRHYVTDETVIETILHEMVHVKQHIEGYKKLKHNKYFFKTLKVACKKANVTFDKAFANDKSRH